MRQMDLDVYPIHVTSEHINRPTPPGMPRSFSCPIANALNAETRCLWAVGRRDAWRRDASLAWPRNVIGFPAWVQDIIGDFDIWGDMEPFAFALIWDGSGWLVERQPLSVGKAS